MVFMGDSTMPVFNQKHYPGDPPVVANNVIPGSKPLIISNIKIPSAI